MPYTLSSVLAKDANQADQSIATAQGDGTTGNPYVPAHADIGIGAPDDPAASSNTGSFSLIALVKRLLSVSIAAIVTELTDIDALLTDIDAAIGAPGDPAATSDTGTFSLIALIKRLLQNINGGSAAATNYSSIGTAATANMINSTAALRSIEAVNLNTATRYLLLFNSTGATTGTPVRVFPVYGNGGLLVIGAGEFGANGLNFSTGITWAMSTTPLTYTAATPAETIVTGRYS